MSILVYTVVLLPMGRAEKCGDIEIEGYFS